MTLIERKLFVSFSVLGFLRRNMKEAEQTFLEPMDWAASWRSSDGQAEQASVFKTNLKYLQLSLSPRIRKKRRLTVSNIFNKRSISF